MTLSLRLSEKDSAVIKEYAKLHGLSVSELVRQSVFERIENELDLKAYESAMDEYRRNPVTFSHKDVKRLLETVD